jgi:hypothetical protein
MRHFDFSPEPYTAMTPVEEVERCDGSDTNLQMVCSITIFLTSPHIFYHLLSRVA